MLKLLFGLLFFVFCPLSVATATDYTITESQLMRLEQNLIQLKATNEQLQKELAMLRNLSKEQEVSLMNVSQSFDRFAASQTAKLRKSKAERNSLLVILLGVVIGSVAK